MARRGQRSQSFAYIRCRAITPARRQASCSSVNAVQKRHGIQSVSSRLLAVAQWNRTLSVFSWHTTHQLGPRQTNTKLSCRRQAARCLVSQNSLLTYSGSPKLTPFRRSHTSSYIAFHSNYVPILYHFRDKTHPSLFTSK